jgi:hypothetical protein
VPPARIGGSVVEQGGADDLNVIDVVVADDPQRHAQQVINVRLTLAAVPGMQIPASCGARAACSGRPGPGSA